MFGGECEDTTALVFTGTSHRGATLDDERSLQTSSPHRTLSFSSLEQNVLKMEKSRGGGGGEVYLGGQLSSLWPKPTDVWLMQMLEATCSIS